MKLTLHRLRLSMGAFLGGILNASSSLDERISPSPAVAGTPAHSSSYFHLGGGSIAGARPIAGETTPPQARTNSNSGGRNQHQESRSNRERAIRDTQRERGRDPVRPGLRRPSCSFFISCESFSSLFRLFWIVYLI